MKHHNQSNKAKEEFLRTSPLYGYMKDEPNRVYTREELSTAFGVGDREIRRMVAELANYVPIISTSDKKGYRLVSFTNSDSVETLMALNEDIDHQISEHKSRVVNLKARMKPLVAIKKVLEKRLANNTKPGPMNLC